MKTYWWVLGLVVLLIVINLAVFVAAPALLSSSEKETPAAPLPPILQNDKADRKETHAVNSSPQQAPTRSVTNVTPGGQDVVAAPPFSFSSTMPAQVMVNNQPVSVSPVFFQGNMGMSAEQRAELDELRRNNPQAYGERFRQVMEEMREKQTAEANAMKDLVENYRTTRNESSRQELLAKLEANFEQEIERLRAQVKSLEAHLEKRLAGKDAHLEQLLEKMLAQPR